VRQRGRRRLDRGRGGRPQRDLPAHRDRPGEPAGLACCPGLVAARRQDYLVVERQELRLGDRLLARQARRDGAGAARDGTCRCST